MKIPFNKLYTTGREIEYMKNCLEQGDIAGDGHYTCLVQDYMNRCFGCRRTFLTTSGTSALEMAALLIGLRPGDEVIMPSFTFVSTANAVLLRGAVPVFVEVQKDTLNLDIDDVVKKITSNTKAIIPVHYGGVACDMGAVMKTAREHNLFVIEDAAQGVNALYHDQYLGTIGDIGCYSFHGSKNYVCGEGGALLLNNGDEALLKKAEYIWEKGTNRSSFLRGQVDKYTWMDVGSSYLPSDILAACLYAQLQEKDLIQTERKRVYDYYCKEFLPYARMGMFDLPVIPAYAQSNYHIFHILFPTAAIRDAVMKQLRSKGVEACFHYIPLHSSPMGIKLGWQKDDLPVTEELSGRLLRLPLFAGMKLEEMSYVVECLKDCLKEMK